MEGWRRLSPRSPNRQRPITMVMLKRLVNMLKKVCQPAFEAALFKAAFSLAFFRAFRMSELLACARDDRSNRALAIMDISIKGSELHIQLRRSKTDQLVQGAQIILHSGPKSMPCPVCSFQE